MSYIEQRPNYTDLELKHDLSDVFSSVYFINKRFKKKIVDSYFLNFENLMNYARANHIDEKQYIHSIQQDLLQLPQTYAVRHFYTKYELKCALIKVFDSVSFADTAVKLSLQDSYLMSIDSLADYATEKHIDAVEYINSIRDILLKLPGCKVKKL